MNDVARAMYHLTEKSLQELKFVVENAKPGDTITYKQDSWWLIKRTPMFDFPVDPEVQEIHDKIMARVARGCANCGQPFSRDDFEADMPARGGFCAACR